ncbi:oxidoreductase, zinc-binding dehydrogenase family protein [Artemisia annua]|uniref:Oxidoreductase, zinc-binding dehydrogenase family protein n=1 Tax=Artemisia annua TaxID=35608 RepID=A0A2U1LYG2_ARTAN|nr:oxidoreductase, zinc-binding dehydrogenase family protein [Artemisia annua]
MVKTVTGEEHRLNSVEDRLSHSGLKCQVGLVIGKISTNLDKGFVFDLIPTPVNDAGDDATWIVESRDESKKKGGGGKKVDSTVSVLEVDKEWVAEHARQVSRMLVGGMKVVGIYIWVNENLFKNSTLVLCQTVKGVADAAPIRDIGWDERLLIHISLSPRRWTCRNCSLSSNMTSSSLRPCDFKMGRVLSTLQKFKCIYNFDIRFPIFRENISSSENFAGILRDLISSHAKELKEVKALVDGNLVNVDEPCAFDGLHEVEFLTPFMQHTPFQAYNEDEVVGILVFSGSICSFAYSNSKEPISQALADIKGDIISSLHSRLDIICDEADGQMESIADDGESVNENSTQTPTPQLQLQLLRKWCSLSFPRRVFVPWLGDTYICDYIQPSETLEVLNEHCVELMSMEAPTDASTILEPEAESTSSLTLSPNSFWEKAMPLSSESGSSSLKNSNVDKSSAAGKHIQKSSNISIVLALLVLILSVLAGVFLFASRT